jgi:uncharacterized protein YyaL (SSP411 family)
MVAWLMDPPMREVAPEAAGLGSFSHGVDAETGAWLGQYTEITGYGVSLMAHLYRWHGETRFLEAARQAARFLATIQTERGGFPDCPRPAAGCAGQPSHTFDTAMCTMGLMDLYAVDADDEYLERARRASRWLLELQQKDGSFRSAEGPQEEHDAALNFFDDGSCIHVKNAMALLKVDEAVGTGAFTEAARRACDYALRLQDADGFFWALPSRRFVFTHAHCYACEGLLSAGAYLEEERYTRAALKGIQWLQKVQNADGSVYQVYTDRRPLKERLRGAVSAHRVADATSQAARLFALSGSGYRENYRRALAFVTGPAMSEQGGLYYTRSRFGVTPRLFAWPTMFAIEAIEFATQTVSPRDLF